MDVKNKLAIFKYNNLKIGWWTNKFKLNDVVYIEGTIEKIGNSNINNYLKSENIFFVLNKVEKSNLISTKYNFYNLVNDYFQNGKIYYLKIIPLLFTGYKSHDNQIIVELTKKLGIVHLFVISGFHIGIIKLIINFTMIKTPFIIKEFIFNIVVLIYLILLNFPISALRAFLFLNLLTINKKFLNSYFHKTQILTILALFFIALNPFYIYSLSFLLSFTITFFILLTLEVKIKKKWVQKFLILIIANLVSLPIMLFINKSYNIFTIFNSFIFSPFISIFYVLTLILFWEKNLMNFLAKYFYDFLFLWSIFQYFVKITINDIEIIFLYYIIFILCILFMAMKTTLSIKKSKKLSKNIVNLKSLT